MRDPSSQDDADSQDSGAKTGSRAALAGGAALTALSRAYAQLAQIVIFVFAARTLGPAEFGVFALVSAFAFIALKISEAGWAEYIMAWSGDTQRVREVLGLSWISGLAMMVVGLGAAALMPAFTEAANVQILVLGFAVWLLLATPSAALNGVMVWRGRLAAFALCGMAAETVGLVVTLLALMGGYGVLALVMGRLALQVVFLMVALTVTRVLPTFSMARGGLRELFGFSANILASRLILALRNYAAVFIVGGFFGPAAVGFFRAGQRVVGAFSELVGEPTRILAWRSFRSARDTKRPEAMQDCANTFFPMVGVFAIPGYIWISLFAEPVIVGLLGAEWAPAAPVVALLSIAALFWAIGFTTEPLMSLTGNTRLLPRLFMVYAVFAIVITLIAGPYGMIVVSAAQIFVGMIVVVANIYIYKVKLGLRWLPILRRLLPAAVPIVLCVALLIFLDGLDIAMALNPLVRAVLISLPVLVLYLALLLLIYRPRLRGA